MDSSETGVTFMTEELRTEAKKSAVTFKIPDADNRLGKSVGDITAGRFKTIFLYLYTSFTLKFCIS